MKPEEVLCEWSPLQVDLWAVDRADLSDAVVLAGDEGAEWVVGDPVGRWSEAEVGRDRDLLDDWGAPRLVTTEVDRDTVTDALGVEFDTLDLEAVHIDTHVVVLVGYYRCDEYSRVLAAPDGSALDAVVVHPREVRLRVGALHHRRRAVEREGLASDVTLVAS